MSTAFRLTALGGGVIGSAPSLDGAIELARGAPPGRYRLDQVSLDPATGDLRSWDWGEVIKDQEGRIKLDLPPWLH